MLADKKTNESFVWDFSASLRRLTTQTLQCPFLRFAWILNDRLWLAPALANQENNQ